MNKRQAMWWAVSTGAGALGVTAVRTGLNRAWKYTRDEDPPENPASWDVTWRDAILWTVATGVVVGLGRLLMLRGAAAGWQRVTGRAPPV